MKLRKSTAVLAVVLMVSIGLGVPYKARAGGVFIGATEITQLLNHVELVSQYVQQVEQYETQLKQYERQMQDGQIVGTQFFGPIQSDLLGLERAVQGGQAISYSMGNLDSQFTSKFGGYGYRPTQNFAQNYATWSQTSLDSTQHALDGANLQSAQLTNEESLINQLNTMSQSSTGQLEAIQIGNQIASEEVQQLMKLRQLMMADLQSKASYQASQIQMTADSTAASTNFFTLKTSGLGTGASADAVPAVSTSIQPR
jgi:P-type conjugative transfer protein TrbJ